MNADHARFAEWDAAYLMGALNSADRRRFEEHLDDCEACGRAVAELAPVIGLLGRVERRHAESHPAETPAGPDPSRRVEFARIATADRVRRRRRQWWTGAAVAAVAATVAVVLAVTLPLAPAPEETTVVTMQATSDIPLEATAELTEVDWGTRIDLECIYGGSGGGYADWPYELYVIGRDGAEEAVSSWRARPGTTAQLSAGTALDLGGIETLEIRAVGSGQVLMRVELSG
ncbi:anti-sigma factor [Microbacterium sp.]|uniref:anti-sigma factor family protein n=1 Tax=Microbacterium sp. TaxID=51671 RepID=UPI002734685E|nr:zf-HC2 domain-containing protein [Microbacterium sp.]MDP3949474.1 zf-HC2 domain-containing protein [Microbacterium sp.]